MLYVHPHPSNTIKRDRKRSTRNPRLRNSYLSLRKFPRFESANVDTPIIQHDENLFPRDLRSGSEDHVKSDSSVMESDRVVASEWSLAFGYYLFLNPEGRCYDGFCEGGV